MLTWATAYYTSEWLIRLIMLVYVPQRRTPAAARSWLLLIFLFPWPGFLFYGLIGRPYLPRRRVQLQQHVSELIRTTAPVRLAGKTERPTLPPPWTELATLAQNLGDFPLRAGNKIELLPEYQNAIDRLIADIDAAKHHVHLLYYIFGTDRTGRSVIDAVLRAAKRGVRCRILVDGAGSKRAVRKVGKELAAAGVELVPLLRVGLLRRNAARFDLRNHRKIAVIDGRIGYTGSQNMVNADFKRGLVYEELVARITGPVVVHLQTVLLADLYAETLRPPDVSDLLPELPEEGGAVAVAIPSGPSYPHLNNLDLIVALTHAAQRRIVFTSPYFIPSEPLIQAIQTAVLRGVEVHLIVSRQIDQMLVGLAQRSYYEQLLEAGVHIHEYRPKFLHSKFHTFDDSIALAGSSNMDIRSFQLNEEISLLIHDRDVVFELSQIQNRYFEGADELTVESWRKRPRILRVIRNVARLADALL